METGASIDSRLFFARVYVRVRGAFRIGVNISSALA